MIAKAIIDVAKGIRTNTCTVSISGIDSWNDNFNNKALNVNDELSKTYRDAKLDSITHKNINRRVDLSKSKLRLNGNGSDKTGKNLVNFFWNIINEGTRKIA